MRRFILSSAAVLTCFVLGAVTIGKEHKERARKLVEAMTLDEKIDYLSGETSFSLRPVERLGIPRILLADGPQGIRNHCEHSTLYPSGILLAATWNRDLARRYGESLGDDARARGVGILLGPGVNMYRSPLCGRNFEYMGEDPFLTSEIAAYYINGVQSRGVIATIKHFAGNNQEWNRHHASSDIDERSLNEIYFPAFRKAVQKAGVGAVMNSYNLLNGVHATENRWLDTDVLRETWGFDGILMSDWTSVYSTVNAANAGLDLEMPKGVFFTRPLIKDAIATGRITEETINRKVEHLLSTFIAFGLLDREQKDTAIPQDNDNSRLTALDVAREGIVLLKNSDGILPLKGRTVVLGPNAGRIPTGGGSGFVSPFSVTTVAAGMSELNKRCVALTDDILYRDVTGDIYTDSTCTERGFAGKYYKNMTREGEPAAVRTDSVIKFVWQRSAPFDGFPEDHFSAEWTAFYRPEFDTLLKIRVSGDDGYRVSINGKVIAADWGNHALSSREVEYSVEGGKGYDIHVEYFDNISDATMVCSIMALNEQLLARELKRADNVVYCTGFNSDVEGEGFDRNFALPSYQERFMKRLLDFNPNLVVVVNAGGGVDFSAWDELARAILLAWYPGQEGGRAIAEILTGRLSPSGKLPISIENRLEDNPCAANYHKNAEPKERECAHVDYREGVFTGYRGYDRSGVKPRYPFGFGLGYSTFEFGNLEISKTGENEVEVSFDIRNTGKVKAAEVAQIYVSDSESSVPRPAKELKGFEKVTLNPGESRRVTVTLDKEAFEYYDMNAGSFVVEPGKFVISVGNSSDNLPLKSTVIL
ncbi:MAG: glycoside hydrolase family 3 C-terminal domain-containing protein [Muribaculaceae bacterium]|nr:glycoside hydrolase family 3 C-terminal domain-containing protein [Muribaculaceae bacterium]